jgi:hypothetical protein
MHVNMYEYMFEKAPRSRKSESTHRLGQRSPTAAHTESSQQKHRPGGATQRNRFLSVHHPMNVYVSDESVAARMRAIAKLFVDCQALRSSPRRDVLHPCHPQLAFD